MSPDDFVEPLQQRHVVVCVDDEPSILSALGRTLRREPYEFLTTESPDQALDWVLLRKASLFLSDQRMPGIAGVDLLRLVQACSPSTIRVMITGHSDLTGILSRQKIDAIQKVVRKPWDDAKLRQTLRMLLHRVERGVPVEEEPA